MAGYYLLRPKRRLRLKRNTTLNSYLMDSDRENFLRFTPFRAVMVHAGSSRKLLLAITIIVYH